MTCRYFRYVIAALALCAGAAQAQSAADLAITKTDGLTTVAAGAAVTYTIIATNAGPDAALGATVVDTLPAVITGASWTCVGAGGGTCTAAGSGNLNDLVNLPVGAAVTYTLSGTVSAAATGTLANTASITGPAGTPDPNPADNSATDADTLLAAPPVTTPHAVPASSALALMLLSGLIGWGFWVRPRAGRPFGA